MENLSPGLPSLDPTDFESMFADLLDASSSYSEGSYSNTQFDISLPEPYASDLPSASYHWYETNAESHTQWKSHLGHDLTLGEMDCASRREGTDLGSSTFTHQGTGLGGEVDCRAAPNHGMGRRDLGHGPQGAKAGSQAFNYIADFAVQEINGIIVDHTDAPKKSLTTLDNQSCLSAFCQLEGSEEKEHPEKCISLEALLASCETLAHAGTAPQPEVMDLVEVQDTSKKGEMVGCVQTPKKKRRRKRKPLQEGGTKKKKYELEPLSDAMEERRRKDAVRAKQCREKNRKEVLELKDSLNRLQKEKDDLAHELAGIRHHQANLLNLLKAKYNIILKPYHHSLK